MSRLLMLLLAVAAIGGYSLTGSSSGTTDSTTSAEVAAAASDAASSGLVNTLASSMLGIQVQAMPDAGCTTSIISADKVVALIESLPAAQQVALAKAMNASAALWTAELYTGTLGTGLCLPVQNKLILFPAGSTAATTITSMVQALGSAIPH
ncbi:hypothetical protein AB4Y45_34930 [Paraburkholderia sp. EG287A]|uniref:hypothetical protein n=1 Tax=Paraburkholderia sp. EG287A TaxID=3237012 RepID=UPI0034D1A2C9